MRVAIMQPYLFPYVGYFQLLHHADVFVLLDDVAFIQKGWINRNQLLVGQKPYLFTIPLAGSSQNKLIKDINLLPVGRAQHKLLATIEQAYRAAPEFERVFPLVTQLLLSPEPDLTTLVHDSLQRITTQVGLPTTIIRSSAVNKDPKLTGQGRILALCQALGGTEYLNMQSGAALYSADAFGRRGIALRFLAPTLAPYPQRGAAFVPGLSVIDVLMHNPPAHVRGLFGQGVLS
jgi:hypothetical protein